MDPQAVHPQPAWGLSKQCWECQELSGPALLPAMMLKLGADSQLRGGENGWPSPCLSPYAIHMFTCC